MSHPASVMRAYDRPDVTFVKGEGSWLVASDGRRYLDFVAGIAVVALGHRHPAVTAAARAQLDRLWHTSNLYWTEPMTALADRLTARFGGGQAFFCNSGTEAIEAALKYARKATGRTRIVALENSFHGRTFGSLSVTGQPAKRTAFEPLVPGVAFARLGDADSLRAACEDGEPPACILLEAVQGEGGIRPASPEFLAAAAELAAESEALLAIDEIQTGIGRTGTFFAFEQLGVRPSLVTLAKGLANGLPVGCLLVDDGAAGAFQPGDHGTTFGGNPVACAAGCAVVDAITDELLAAVRARGAQVAEGLAALPGVLETRGLGLLVGAELEREASEVVRGCLERGLLVSVAGERVIRLTPPLTVAEEEVEQALAVLGDVLG